VAAEHVEEVCDTGGRALEGEVVGIPRLEDGWVRFPEDFSKWHEADPI
jgi:hypothetical protein